MDELTCHPDQADPVEPGPNRKQEWLQAFHRLLSCWKLPQNDYYQSTMGCSLLKRLGRGFLRETLKIVERRVEW